MKNTLGFALLLLLLAPLAQCRAASESASVAESGPQALVGALWQADSEDEVQQARDRLLAAASDVETLYHWLQEGPVYSDSVPRGQLQRVRISADGTEFPYVVLVPQKYDASRPIPLEFNLHGGVNRPKPAAGDSWWRNGYDHLRDPERIVVLPAGWNEAFWWFDNQAENLPAILALLKQDYNIDENRVTLSGVSDGGTGSYFFAFHQPTAWAAFLPFIGSPGVLSNPSGQAVWELFYDNLRGKPLYIVNGENDPLYPASRVERYIKLMAEARVEHVFRVIEDGRHDTVWLPAEKPALERFRLDNPRDPLPDSISWVSNRTNAYNRNHWIRIDSRNSPGRPGVLEVSRNGNQVQVNARYTSAFTLLLSPEEFDFSRPVSVVVNGVEKINQLIPQSMETLLKWATADRDRTMLFTAELQIELP